MIEDSFLVFRAVVGLAFGLVIPGWVWSMALFSKENFSALDHLLIGLCLNLAFLPPLVYGLRGAGVPLTEVWLWVEVCGVAFLGWFVYAVRHRKST